MHFLHNVKMLNEVAASYFSLTAAGKICSFPTDVFLTLTQKCNYRCRMCYQQTFTDDMDDAVLEQVRPLLPYAKTVHLLGGEPLVYRGYDAIVEQCLENRCSISICTNGSLLHEDRCRKLASIPSGQFNISIDAATPSTYRFIRKGDFFKVLKNVAVLSKHRLDSQEQSILRFKFVAMKENVHELPKLVALASELGVDEIAVNYLVATNLELAKSSVYFLQEESDAALSKAKAIGEQLGVKVDVPHLFSNFSNEDEPETQERSACYRPWRNLHVAVDGKAYLCCASNGVMPPSGNIVTDGFSTLWNNAFTSSIRTGVNSAKLPPPCRRCYVYKASPRDISQHIQGAALAEQARRELAPA